MYGVRGHSTAKTPKGTGVVTDRTACHHARNASGVEKAVEDDARIRGDRQMLLEALAEVRVGLCHESPQ